MQQMRQNMVDVRYGDVWWVSPLHTNGLHINQGKPRPFVIVSCNNCNKSSGNVTAVPCTTQKKKELPTHVTAFFNHKENTIQCEQVTTFGKEFLLHFVDTVGTRKMLEVQEALKIHLGMEVADET